jgi:hypothetical protein
VGGRPPLAGARGHLALPPGPGRAHHAPQAFDSYLGWLANPATTPHYQPLDPAQYGFVRDWGLELVLQDVRVGERVPCTQRGQAPARLRHAGRRERPAQAAVDEDEGLSLIHVRAGQLGPTGDWVDGEVTPIARLTQTFAQEPANAAEWYSPARLTLDLDAANALTRNAQTRLLGLRPYHRREVDLPLYAIRTDLSAGGVLRGARRFIRGSAVPRTRSILVDASKTESHLDPLTAAAARNRFLRSVVPSSARCAEHCIAALGARRSAHDRTLLV